MTSGLLDRADSLTSQPPILTAAEAASLARRHFGVDGAVTQLASERDANFRIQVASGESFVLKVANPAEEAAVTNLQTEALLHVARRDADLPVQRVVPNLAGTYEESVPGPDGRPSILRLVSYLEGLPLCEAPGSSAQRWSLGESLARLTQALSDFSHPATDHDLQWDIKHAHRLWQLLPHVEGEDKRRLVERILRNFDDFVAPVMAELRTQFVHNDFNPYNVLVAPTDPARVTGILDFGDIVFTPLVMDLAVAASYQLSPEGDPLAGGGDVIAAYHRGLPLQQIELGLLYDLIGARLATSACISAWRAARYPENRDYILRNAPRAWAGLEVFAALPRERAQEQLRRVCGVE